MSLFGPHRSTVSSALWRNAFCFRLCAVAFFTLSFLFPTLAQNIAVSDFRLLENDMTANLDGSTVYDQNSEKCALIKVETTQTGFTFDTGSLGVAKTLQQPGEIWVYVPDRTSRITISHPQLGTLRNYDLGLSVRKARTYLLKLTTGTVQTIVQPTVTRQYLVFQVTPAHAVVEVEDEVWPVSDGTARKFLPFGTYNYRVQAQDYHVEAGRVTVNDPNNKTVVTVTLRPAFGWVEVPGAGDLSGAYVYIDNQLVGQAPVKSGQLASGSHNVKVVKPLYKTFEQTVTVSDNETLRLTPPLSADFSTVTLTTDAAAEIWVNGERKGSGNWTGPLQSGEYLFETRRENHRAASTTRTITAAQRQQTISLPAPVPIYGSLNIATTPDLSDVLLDGTPVGQTPLFLPQVLIGNHTVTVRKANRGDYKTTVSIAEGQTAVVEGELSSLTAVTLDCNAQGAQIWVDGTALGAISAVRQLAYGPHQVVLRAEGYNDFTGNITVTDADHAFKFTMTEKEGAKRTFTVKGVKFTMVSVAGGTFQMGATAEQQNPNSDEKPVHRVTLSSYYIGQTEVTQALWEAVMGTNPSNFKGADLPVEKVSWDDCQTFIKKLNALTGQTFRLPTEAEWEYAARGGAKSKGYQYSGSNNLGEVAWYTDNSGGKTHAVGTKRANELGLYDMSGNVWEWCQDWYGSYSSSAQTNPQGASSGSNRVDRGGSWDNNAWNCRVAIRCWSSPGYRGYFLGLRLVL